MRLDDINSRAIGRLVQESQDSTKFLKKLLDENILLSVDPATVANSADAVNTAIAGAGFTRDVVCKVVDSDTELIEYYNGTLPVAVSVVTVGDGAATITGSTVDFVNGTVTVTITYTGTWASGDTCTFTLGSSSSIGGVSVADKTSVDTLVA